VEVPLREEGANPVSGRKSIDQRMPPEPGHGLLSPFRKSVSRKPPGNGWDKAPQWRADARPPKK